VGISYLPAGAKLCALGRGGATASLLPFGTPRFRNRAIAVSFFFFFFPPHRHPAEEVASNCRGRGKRLSTFSCAARHSKSDRHCSRLLKKGFRSRAARKFLPQCESCGKTVLKNLACLAVRARSGAARAEDLSPNGVVKIANVRWIYALTNRMRVRQSG